MIDEKELIKLAAKAGAEAALEKLERERQKQFKGRYDKRLRNTKLLLKNYKLFKRHLKNAIYNASQIEEDNAIDILDLMWDPLNSHDMIVESIKKSAVRTKVIIEHIDSMLEIYEMLCLQSKKPEDIRRWRVLQSMYLLDEDTSIDDIAFREDIDSRTVYRDIDTSCDKLAALIFGVDFVVSKE